MQDPGEFLRDLVGAWDGTCRTWFQPGQLDDESPIRGKIQPILKGLFFRHTYEGAIQGRPRAGEETIGFNSVAKRFEVAWFDDFHMNYAVMFSIGEQIERGFTVTGQYAVAADTPPWNWKTVYERPDDDQLLMTAFNISPDGQEAKAVETIYRRIGGCM